MTRFRRLKAFRVNLLRIANAIAGRLDLFLAVAYAKCAKFDENLQVFQNSFANKSKERYKLSKRQQLILKTSYEGENHG